MDVCAVNMLFSVMKAYDLLMAQLSVCRAHWSYTPVRFGFGVEGSIDLRRWRVAHAAALLWYYCGTVMTVLL